MGADPDETIAFSLYRACYISLICLFLAIPYAHGECTLPSIERLDADALTYQLHSSASPPMQPRNRVLRAPSVRRKGADARPELRQHVLTRTPQQVLLTFAVMLHVRAVLHLPQCSMALGLLIVRLLLPRRVVRIRQTASNSGKLDLACAATRVICDTADCAVHLSDDTISPLGEWSRAFAMLSLHVSRQITQPSTSTIDRRRTNSAVIGDAKSAAS